MAGLQWVVSSKYKGTCVTGLDALVQDHKLAQRKKGARGQRDGVRLELDKQGVHMDVHGIARARDFGAGARRGRGACAEDTWCIIPGNIHHAQRTCAVECAEREECCFMRKYRYGTFHKFFLDCARRHTAPCAATQRPVCQPPPAAARTGTPSLRPSSPIHEILCARVSR